MLVSCTQQPVDDGSNSDQRPSVGESDHSAEVMSTEAVGLSLQSEDLTGVVITVESDFSNALVIQARNVSQNTMFLSPNFGATSRIAFYDSLGEQIDAGGFEGRPERGAYRQLDPNSVITLRYDNSMFVGEPIRSAQRICLRAQVSNRRDFVSVENGFICLFQS